MVLKISIGSEAMNVVFAYASQVGYSNDQKDKFRIDLGAFVISTISKYENVLPGADLNGHVGQKVTARVTVMATWIWIRNAEGEESLTSQMHMVLSCRTSTLKRKVTSVIEKRLQVNFWTFRCNNSQQL